MPTEPLEKAAPTLFEKPHRYSTIARYERLYRLILIRAEDGRQFSAPDLTRWSRYTNDYYPACRVIRALAASGRIIRTSPPKSKPIYYKLKESL